MQILKGIWTRNACDRNRARSLHGQNLLAGMGQGAMKMASGPIGSSCAPRATGNSPFSDAAALCHRSGSDSTCVTKAIPQVMPLLLASFMVVFPSADLSAATGNPFLGRYQSGRGDGSRYGDKEKYQHSKWHVHR